MGDLKRASGSNRFCGPYVVAHLLDVDRDEAARRIRIATGKRLVMGLSHTDLWRALAHVGIFKVSRDDFTPVPVRERPTVAAYLRKVDRGALVIVSTTDHYILVDGRKIYDNAHPEGVPRREWGGRRARVHAAWELSRASVEDARKFWRRVSR